MLLFSHRPINHIINHCQCLQYTLRFHSNVSRLISPFLKLLWTALRRCPCWSLSLQLCKKAKQAFTLLSYSSTCCLVPMILRCAYCKLFMNHGNEIKLRINPQDLFWVVNWMALKHHYYLFIRHFRALQTCFYFVRVPPQKLSCQDINNSWCELFKLHLLWWLYSENSHLNLNVLVKSVWYYDPDVCVREKIKRDCMAANNNLRRRPLHHFPTQDARYVRWPVSS